MNSRPLCPNSDSPSSFENQEIDSRKKWRQAQVLANHYWSRWIKEYVPMLQERQKWNFQRRNLKPNDLVLVVDENHPRGHWLLARVTKVHHGQDGLVRSAEVKTRTGTLVRPIRKLCLLEATTAWTEPKNGWDELTPLVCSSGAGVKNTENIEQLEPAVLKIHISFMTHAHSNFNW